MPKRKNEVHCDYCSKKYCSQKEITAHSYIHVGHDVETLTSSLKALDGDYCLPTARKVFSDSSTLMELLDEDFKKTSEEESKEPRLMSDRIEEMIDLFKRYPLRKSFGMQDLSSSDNAEKNGDEEAVFESLINSCIPDPEKSVPSASDESLNKPMNNVDDIKSCPQSPEKYDSKMGNPVFDKDSTKTSNFSKPAVFDSVTFKNSSPKNGSVLCNVENSDLVEVTASDHAYSKQSVIAAAKSGYFGNSSFLRLVENAVKAGEPCSYKQAPTDAVFGPVNDSKVQKPVDTNEQKSMNGSGSSTFELYPHTYV